MSLYLSVAVFGSFIIGAKAIVYLADDIYKMLHSRKLAKDQYRHLREHDHKRGGF